MAKTSLVFAMILYFGLSFIIVNGQNRPNSLDSLKSLISLGIQKMNEQSYDQAIEQFQQTLELNKQIKSDSMTAYLYYNIALCLTHQEKFGLAIESYNTALNITKKDSSLNAIQVTILWGKGASHMKIGEYIEALKAIDKAISLTSNSNMQAGLFVVAGNIHRKLKQEKLAIESHENAYKIFLVNRDTLKMSMALNNIGTSYLAIESYDQAFEYLSKSLALKRTIQKQESIAFTLNNIGDLHMKLGEYAKAKPYFQEAFEIRKSLTNKQNLINSCNRMGDLYMSMNQLSLAKMHLDKSKSLLETTNVRSEKLENLYLFSKFYYLQGKTVLGDRYHLQYTNLYDSLYNELDVSQSILKSEREKLEAEKAQAATLAQKEILEKENKIQQYQIWIALVLIVLLASLGWSFYRSRNIKKRLAEELNHRTKNNFQLFMSMLGYQKQRFQNPDTQNLISEIQNRMGAMASVHKLLKPQKSLYRVNIQEYIEKILTSVCFSFGYDTNCLHVVIPSIELSMKHANYIGFIVNEVATNAIKYAFPQSENPELHVTLTEDNGKYVLFVQDNGKEIPPHDPNISTSLGMTLIEDFTYMLKGKSHFEHTGEGMIFQLEFNI